MNRCLLLGGAGFIGSALCAHLLQQGDEVTVVSRHHSPPVTGDRLTTCHGSLDDPELLDRLLPHTDTVFYLASDTTPGNSISLPGTEVETNLRPALRFIEIAQQYRHLKIIYLSSGGTVYGDATTLPVSEADALTPVSNYGAAKVAIECFLRAFSHQMQQPVIVLRPSNVYGPGQFYRQNFGLVRTLFERIRTGDSIDIFGDGNIVRDYLYIDDLLNACSRVADHTAEDLFQVFNVGSGEGYTITSICNMIEAITGSSITRNHMPARVGDVREIVLDYSRLQSCVGWEPQHTIHDGLENTWLWLRQQWQISKISL